MKTDISVVAVGHATGLLFAILFVLCVVFDFIFPDHAMYETWQRLLPGFEWISLKSIFIGFVESYAYGWLLAIIWTPIYNVFAKYLSDRTNPAKLG
ncbi:MAG: DUF5676 family membrane protein [Thiohalomonadales bacterium]